MRIKPTYDKSYLVRYRRGKDLQTTEVVDTTWVQLQGIISETFKGRTGNVFTNAQPTTVEVIELDHATHCSQLMTFSLPKGGTMRSIRINNLSPREVRIRIEKAIRQ